MSRLFRNPLYSSLYHVPRGVERDVARNVLHRDVAILVAREDFHGDGFFHHRLTALHGGARVTQD